MKNINEIRTEAKKNVLDAGMFDYLAGANAIQIDASEWAIPVMVGELLLYARVKMTIGNPSDTAKTKAFDPYVAQEKFLAKPEK